MSDLADGRTEVIFLRVTPKEKHIINAAVKLKFGSVRGFTSEFCRRAALALAKQVVIKARDK